MIVPSFQFLGFAALGALLFNIGRASWWRQLVLLVWNLLFIASFTHNPVAVLPFAGFLLFGYVASQYLVRPGASRATFVAVLLITIGLFFWLKRYTFVPSALLLPNIFLLLGLSYVFFRVLHVIIDSYQGNLEERITPISYVNYTLNFTALVSGPIQRYEDYHATELQRLPLDLSVIGAAVERIIVGYFKVALVSALLSFWQHQVLESMAGEHDFLSRVANGMQVVGIYPVYLYFNFSGYVDVVIGVARFFGIVLPENFDHPFVAENFINFWSRWHMTLSGWLKTYVYNPSIMFLMERVTQPSLAPYLAAAAFFVTFFLVGLWHGQTSEFLFFGFLQGGGVAANKFYQVFMTQRLGRKRYRELGANGLYMACMRGLTFTWFGFTLLWFWSTWHDIGAAVGAVGAGGMVAALLALFVLATVVLSAMTNARRALNRVTWSVDPGVREPVGHSRYIRCVTATAMVTLIAANVVLLNAPAPDIVYKAF